MQTTLSFYISGESLIHRLNPLTKLVLVFTLIALTFLLSILWLPSILFLCVVLPLSFIARVQRPFIGAIARLLLPVVGFIFIMQAFFHPGGENEIFRLWFLTITAESLQFAFQTATRILVMVSSFLILLLTTHPSDLMNDLTRRGLPGTFSYVITATLQIIPQMQAKAATIIAAQQARGLETGGNILKRAGALTPLVGPLVFGSLVDVEERAIAIEARGFSAAIQKTSLREIADPPFERAVRWLMLLVILATIGLRLWR